MTAPAPRPGPDVAGQLAEAVPFTTVMRFHGPAEVPSRAEREHIAAALLPVVQRLAVEKAAEAVAVIQKFIAVAPVMWHGDYPVKAVPVSDLLSALALTAAAQPTDGGT